MPSIMKGDVSVHMTPKSFDEFKSSLTQKDIEYITGVNDEESTDLKIDPSDPNVLMNIMGYINAKSFGTNLRLLELYHEWLSE